MLHELEFVTCLSRRTARGAKLPRRSEEGPCFVQQENCPPNGPEGPFFFDAAVNRVIGYPRNLGNPSPLNPFTPTRLYGAPAGQRC